MRYFFYIVFFINFLSIDVLALDNKTIDAPAFTKKIKDLYKNENKIIKNSEKVNYSGVPGSKFWRDIRSGGSYKTQLQGDDIGVLINAKGENWRQTKVQVTNASIIVIPLAFIIPILLFVIFGKFKLKDGFSNKTVERFKLVEIIIHWGTAVLFILLSITGFILLLGKYLLIPVMGKSTFAVFAEFSLDIHDFFGPIFSIFLLAIIIKFIKDNFYQKGDINWLLKGGGLLGKHVDVWRFNLGEKAWFWVVFFAGLLIAISGYIMLFTGLVAGEREIIELMNITHVVAAILMISGMFGHIYMGVTMEGSMSAMKTGKVDENWAKEHHNLWYKSKLNKNT